MTYILIAFVIVCIAITCLQIKRDLARFNARFPLIDIVQFKCTTARFNERFPPIDDDEFVRLCGPDVNRDTAIRVRRIVSEQLGVEYARVYPDQRFVEDLGCD
ncbi:MAG: hypothetical protein ABI619_09375 [Betaproteobacteria bacterium]